MGRPRRRPRRRHRRSPGTRPDLHRPAPRSRGDQSAGVRRAAARRPRRPATGPDDRHRGPQRADDRHRQADRRSGIAHSGRDAATQLRRVRHPAASDGRPRARHRAHHRTATRSHSARHDDRLRRQPHLHPRRVRRIGDGHRHIGGRACARHADTAAASVQDDGGQRRRPTACRSQRQGHHLGGDRQDRHRRRAGPRHRIPGQCHRIAVDGRPDDDLQHEHRGRGARRHGRARRNHVRISARPSACPDGCGLGCGGRGVGPVAHRRRRRVRHRGVHRRRRR